MKSPVLKPSPVPIPRLLIFCLCLMVQAGFATAQEYQKHVFKTVPFGGGGCVTGIITCPTKKNLIFARTDVGGAFRWVESTKSWKSLHFAAPGQGCFALKASQSIRPHRTASIAWPAKAISMAAPPS